MFPTPNSVKPKVWSPGQEKVVEDSTTHTGDTQLASFLLVLISALSLS